MARREPQYGCLPSRAQEFLLRAALLDGPDAMRAWDTWHNQVDLDAIDGGTLRLLPLLYKNVTKLGVDDPSLGRLRGVYRQTWYRNQLIVGRIADLLRAFKTAGIETLVLKGVPLALRYYKDVAVRPMADADILIPSARARDALAVVNAAGWTPRDATATWPPRFTASQSFGDRLGLELDLHAHVLHECLSAEADDDFWACAEPLVVGGALTRALAPIDQLLHTIAHGHRRSTVPPIRWIADVVAIVRSCPGELDWDRLLAQTRVRHLNRIVGHGLRYVRDRFGIDVPARVIAALETAPASVTERMERWARSQPGTTRLVVETWCEYARAEGREPAWTGPLGFLRYTRDRLGADTMWRLPSAAVAKISPGRTRLTPPLEVGRRTPMR